MKYIVLTILALLIFSSQLYRPIDGSSRNVWREVDVGSMARNFYQEDMNIFYPRIDWRGNGPGYVESELPLQSWLGAIFYQLFGYQEWLLRLISMLAMLGSCTLFYFIADLFLNRKGSFLASVIFVIHPFVFLMATAIQPESLMFFAYLSAVYCFISWIQTERLIFYWLSIISMTSAILIKLPAVQIGIFFALLSFYRFGFRALKNPRLWCFAIITLGISFLWYAHARNLWIEYGNSLGISNEAYARIGKSTYKEFLEVNLLGNFLIEAKNIWIGTGIILGFFGAYAFRKETEGKIILFWAISLLVYYILCGGTTGESWAAYYHILSVPFASIMIAKGYLYLNGLSCFKSHLIAKTLLSLIIIVEVGVIFYINFFKPLPNEGNFQSAQQFKSLIPKNELIIVNGGAQIDPNGRYVASNPPYYFFWLGHKGFTLNLDKQSIETVEKMRELGAKYFVVEKHYLDTNPDFYKIIFQKFRIISQTDWAILVDLTSEKNH